MLIIDWVVLASVPFFIVAAMYGYKAWRRIPYTAFGLITLSVTISVLKNTLTGLGIIPMNDLSYRFIVLVQAVLLAFANYMFFKDFDKLAPESKEEKGH